MKCSFLSFPLRLTTVPDRLFCCRIEMIRPSLVAQKVKNLPAMQETCVPSLGWEHPLKKGMITHFSILAWRIPWTEDSGRLQYLGSQRVEHYWATFITTTTASTSPLRVKVTTKNHQSATEMNHSSDLYHLPIFLMMERTTLASELNYTAESAPTRQGKVALHTRIAIYLWLQLGWDWCWPQNPVAIVCPLKKGCIPAPWLLLCLFITHLPCKTWPTMTFMSSLFLVTPSLLFPNCLDSLQENVYRKCRCFAHMCIR